jgi:manganese efflux pump family protein
LKNLEIILIAFGLAMDCFAVSITAGATNKKITKSKTIEVAIFFGVFQALMPIIGWLLGFSVKEYIENIDHWIAFGIFLLIGGKMIYETFRKKEEKKILNIDNVWVIIALSIATSIDALIVGTSFVFLKVYIIKAIIIIGSITFFVSLLGIFVGKRYGYFWGNKAEWIGGIVLIGIGTKILLEHLALI